MLYNLENHAPYKEAKEVHDRIRSKLSELKAGTYLDSLQKEAAQASLEAQDLAVEALLDEKVAAKAKKARERAEALADQIVDKERELKTLQSALAKAKERLEPVTVEAKQKAIAQAQKDHKPVAKKAIEAMKKLSYALVEEKEITDSLIRVTGILPIDHIFMIGLFLGNTAPGDPEVCGSILHTLIRELKNRDYPV